MTLRIVAEHADIWNGFAPPEDYARKSRVLSEWCAKVGRDPSEVERSVLIEPEELDELDALVEAGAEHVILELGAPFDLAPVRRLLHAAGESA
ncbi:MAG: hypothetical protein WEA10_08585 [Actinomycetota bacterium]